MSRFNIVKKGYQVSEVDGYLNKLAVSEKKCLQEKSLRIEDLLAENNSLKGQLVQYKGREANVNNALITALDKAQEMEYIAKMRYELELERVKVFRDKWINYCDSVKDRCEITESKGEVIGVLDCLAAELAESICSGISFNMSEVNSDAEKQYRSEAGRILCKLKCNTDIKSPFEGELNHISDETVQSDVKTAIVKPVAKRKQAVKTKNDDLVKHSDDSVPSEIEDIINNPEFEELCKKLGLA